MKSLVQNWPGYEGSLVRRGDIMLWLPPQAVAAWNPECNGKRGGALVHNSGRPEPREARSWPFLGSSVVQDDQGRMRSRVHPKYKTKYRVTNWAAYERSLVRRGDVTLWISPEAVKRWTPSLSGRSGAPQKYLDLAIETAVTL